VFLLGHLITEALVGARWAIRRARPSTCPLRTLYSRTD